MTRTPLMRATAILLLLAASFVACPLHAQRELSAEHQRIDFLTGVWRTISTSPDGTVREGDLTYRWVLGGAWMRVEFRGDVPPGVVWEAHVMQRWNAEAGEYEAWVFGGAGPPVRYRGRSDGPGHLSIEHASASGVTSGIDYRRREDGSVYQENWAIRDDVRHVTLTTTYGRRTRSIHGAKPNATLGTRTMPNVASGAMDAACR
jgi:hypothetical protein